MPSLVYALAAFAAPAAVWGLLTTVHLPPGIVPTFRPVEITIPDSDHFVPDDWLEEVDTLESVGSKNAKLWKHLPEDPSKYDMKTLPDPYGGTIVTFYDLQDKEKLFGESLSAAHPDPAKYDIQTLFEPPEGVVVHCHGLQDGETLLGESPRTSDTLSHQEVSFGVLTQLYESAVRGIKHALSSHGAALKHFQAEIETVHKMANAKTPISLGSVNQLRLEALHEIKKEYGAKSKIFKEAKIQLREALESLRRRVLENNLPLTLVHTHSEEPKVHTRRSLEGYNPQVASVKKPTMRMGGPMPRLNGTVPQPGSCFSSANDLEFATVKCNGHGMPIETSKGGQKCWRCKCTPTKTPQRNYYWVR